MNSLRDQIAKGRVSVQLILAQDECDSLKVPEYYINIPRMSYFPIYLSDIVKYFKSSLRNPENVDSNSWWLEFEGVPVRWNWPVGLSYDLLTGLDPTLAEKEPQHCHIPWVLVLHHDNYPKDYLLAYGDDRVLEDYWLNQIKEACYVRDGSAKAIMKLSKQDTKLLWHSVQNHDYNQYWSILDKLLPSSPLDLKHIPVKLYLPMSNQVLQGLVKSRTPGGDAQSVGTALNTFLPDLFPSRRMCILARPLLHGVILAMDIPLAELLYHAMFFDGFLHISIVMMS